VAKAAFDLLMDRFVAPPSSAVLFNAAWEAGVAFLRDQGIPVLSDQRPSFMGDRASD
jgi:hypothetical protein